MRKDTLKKIFFSSILLMLIPSVSYSQEVFEPYMVKDLATKGEGSGFGEGTVMDGMIYFTTTTIDHGLELWKTDGTEEGTLMIKDIWPGPDSSGPEYLCNVDGTLFFVADDGEHGEELWKSDGTEAGTIMVRNFTSGALASYITDIVNLNGIAIFSRGREIADSYGALGRQHELYRSDGTGPGTYIVKDINPLYNDTVYPPIPLSSRPRNFKVAGDYVYFQAEDGTNGYQLWRTDGTEDGTILIEEPGICPDFHVATNIDRISFYKDGYLFFVANSSDHGFGLWKTNGTPEGTEFVKTIDEDPVSGGSADDWVRLYEFGNSFLISKWGELWISDGTEAGTVRIKNDCYGRPYGNAINGKFVFNIAQRSQTTSELYVTDGTEAGTHLMFKTDDGYYYPSDFFLLEDVLIFVLGDNLWITDGTEQGTIMLFESPFEAPSSRSLVILGNKALFSMDDGIHGGELWATTKIPNSQYLVKDINNIGTEYANIDYWNMYTIGDKLYFTAGTIVAPGGNLHQLWKTDGTAEGTTLVRTEPASRLQGTDEMLFFRIHKDDKEEWYVTEGTPDSTTLFWEDGIIRLKGSVNGKVFFTLSTSGKTFLYITDGTIEGTTKLRENDPWYEHSFGFTEYKGEIYFHSGDKEHGNELWKTDGTQEGTRLFYDINQLVDYGGAPRSSDPNHFYVANGILYFTADIEKGFANALWKTDGTVEGTEMIFDVIQGNCRSNFYPYHYDKFFDCDYRLFPIDVVNDKLILLNNSYFYPPGRYDYYEKPLLWTTDGTMEGTTPIESPLVETIRVREPYKDEMVQLNGELLFSGQDFGQSFAGRADYISSPCTPYGGNEIWKTDGTAEGTVMVTDIAPCYGTPGDTPNSGVADAYSFLVGDDDLYFSGRDENGYALWMTDGSVGNAIRLINYKAPFGYANGTVFIRHNDGIHGNELWAIRTKIFVDGYNTGITDRLYEGKYITTWINDCAAEAKNHGKFVSCVAHLTNDLKSAGVITAEEKDSIQSCAAEADIP